MCFFDQISKRFKLLVLLGLFSLLITPLYAQQSVGIGTNTPNPKAVLQLVSTGQNQGFLLPKLTTAQITALGLTLVDADKGLQVYDSLLQQIRYWDGSNWLSLSTSSSSGTVTSVGLSLPAIFNVSGSPVTTSGLLSATFQNQAQNTVFAGPTVGSASPTFRTLVAGDIPSLPAAIISSGTLPIARGGTNGTAAPTAGAVAYGTGTAYAFTSAGISGQLLQSTGAGAPIWINPPATITASNGLTRTVNDIALGGTLSGETNINRAGFNFVVSGAGDFSVRPGGAGSERLFVDGATGNVGIGNNGPSQALSVAGGVIVDHFGVNAGNFVQSQVLQFGTGSGEGIGSNRTPGLRSLDFYTNTVKRLTISQTGNVGIGALTPLSSLQVGSRMSFFTDPTSPQEIMTRNIYNDGTDFRYILAGGATAITMGDNRLGMFIFPAGLANGIAGSPIGRFNFTTTGLVINGDSPNDVLDVRGPVYINSYATAPGTTTDRLYNVSGDLFWNGTNISSGSSGANQTLSNLTNPTAINQDLRFDNSADRFIGFPAGFSPVQGRSLTLAGEATSGSFLAGGNAIVQGGFSASGVGGGATMSGGSSSTFAGGNVGINAGDGGAQGGSTFIRGGNSSGGTGGNIFMTPGDGFSTNGNLYLASEFGFGLVGRVGIGLNGTTETPTSLLDITSNTSARAALRLRNGVPPTSPNQGDIYADGNSVYYRNATSWVDLGGASGGWSLSGNAGTTAANFIGTTDAQSFRIRTNNLGRVSVMASGEVGIGVVIPNQQLEVLGRIVSRRTDSSAFGVEGGSYRIQEASYVNTLLGSSGYWNLSTGAYGNPIANYFFIENLRAGTIGFRVYQSGNVGIGPVGFSDVINESLGIEGNLSLSNTANNFKTVFNPGVQSTDISYTLPVAQGTINQVLTNNGSGVLSWQSPSGSGWGLTGNAGTNPATNFIGTTDAQPLRFATGVGGIERMRIDATGNFGLGTTAPRGRFSLVSQSTAGVVSGISADNYTSSNPLDAAFIITGRARGTAAVPQAPLAGDRLGAFMGAGWTTGTTFVNSAGIELFAEENFSPTTTGSSLRLHTTPVGTITRTERVRIDAAGNVGIGTTSPGTRLSVAPGVGYPSPALGVASGAFSILSDNGLYGLYSGISTTGNTWFQAMRNDASAIAYSLLLNPSGGNVGIGISTPEAKLHVAGAVANNLQAHFTQGVTDGGFKLTASNGVAGGAGTKQADFGMLYSGSGYGSSFSFYRGSGALDGSIGFNTNGSERIRIDAVGNLGIGTSNPAYRLDLANGTFGFGISNSRTETRNDAGLQGSAGAQSGFFETLSPVNYPTGASSWWHLIDSRHNNPANNYALQIAGSFFDQELWYRKTNNSATTAWSRVLSSSSGWTTTGNSGTNPATNFLGTIDGADLAFRTTNVERMRVTGGGNVGIGSINPQARMEILGNTNSPTLASINQSVASFGAQRLRFSTGDVLDIGFQQTPQYAAWFQAGFNGTSEPILLNPLGGNVAIGHNNPTAAFEVRSNGGFANPQALIYHSNGGVDFTRLRLASSATTTSYWDIAALLTATPATDRLNFWNQGAGIDVMTLTGNGQVGMGVATPTSQAKLHVSFGDIATEGTAFYGIKWVTGNTLQAHMHRWGASNNALYVTNAGSSNLTGVFLGVGATSWTSSSDERLKENIIETRYGLRDILKLSVKEYNFKTSELKERRIGLIAQEVYKVIPEVVFRGDDGEYMGSVNAEQSSKFGFIPWGVDYTSLIPVLIKSTQEIMHKVDSINSVLKSGSLLTSIMGMQSLSRGTNKSEFTDPAPRADEIEMLRLENANLRNELLNLKQNQDSEISALKKQMDLIFQQLGTQARKPE